MKKLLLLLSLLMLHGCSIPTAASYNELDAFNRTEKSSSAGFGKKSSIEIIKDFRNQEMYIEDITAMKEDAEKYIQEHPDLSEERKTALRELKLTPGANKEETCLLLGEPDKISARGDLWIYRINRLRAFTIFIFPVFFAHEGYYLKFEDDRLVAIERHYPEQIVHQASGPGITQANQ